VIKKVLIQDFLHSFGNDTKLNHYMDKISGKCSIDISFIGVYS